MSAPTVNGSLPTIEQLDRALARNDRSNEMAVLGAMMSAPPNSAVPGEIREMLYPGEEQRGVGEHHFVLPTHKLIWATIIRQMDQGLLFDPQALMAALPAEKLGQLGNGVYLVTCIEQLPTLANGTYYAKIVANATLLRGLGEVGAVSAQLAGTAALDDAAEAYDTVRRRLDQLVVPGLSGAMTSWEQVGAEALAEMERLQQLAETPDGDEGVFSTGWPDLDRLLGTVAPGSLIIIAGRPGMAKSTAARNIAQHLAMRKKLPVPFFSLEMSRLEIGLTMMAAGARLKSDAIRHGTLSDEDWVEAARYLGQTADAPLEIDDTPGMNLAYADRMLANVTRKYGRPPAAYVWDYLQLGDERGHGNRQEAVSAMSRGHKLLCKKHNTVGVVLSQLNRGPENRTDKRPQLSDLRESGSLEQDADVVILLHRDDYYDKESPRAGEIDLIVAKHRGGPTDTITLAAQLHMSRLVSMAISA